MAGGKAISINERTALLNKMREPFRSPAQKNMSLYRELCGGKIPVGALEEGMDILWLQSVTDGSESYQAYLVSELWKLISGDVLLRNGHECAACRREAEVVHHRSYNYEVMAGLDDSMLISLCHPCHHYIHFEQSVKTPPAVWDKRFKALQKRFATKKSAPRSILPAVLL